MQKLEGNGFIDREGYFFKVTKPIYHEDFAEKWLNENKPNWAVEKPEYFFCPKDYVIYELGWMSVNVSRTNNLPLILTPRKMSYLQLDVFYKWLEENKQDLNYYNYAISEDFYVEKYR